MPPIKSSTTRFLFVVFWILAGALQYGFHISALNSTQDSIVCAHRHKPIAGINGQATCVEMSSTGFGIVTAAFTMGGFLSSINSGRLADQVGRKAASVYSAGLMVFGAVCLSTGSSLLVLAAGRFIIGLACGISTVLVPLYLSEVAPPSIADSVGVLTQLFICLGVFLAQVISIPLSRPETGYWRLVPLASAAFAVAQIFTAPMMIESPTFIGEQNPMSRLFDVDEDENIPLANGEEEERREPYPPRRNSKIPEEPLNISKALHSRDPDVRSGIRTVVLCQAFQQGSGINAVIYSTSILSAVSPANAKSVTLFVTLMGVIMMGPSALLVNRLTRRTLLASSLFIMSISSIVLAYSINNSLVMLATVFIVLFVCGFFIGAGPIPFLLLGEVPPPEARAASASLALATNWALNLVVGLSFLPARDWLSQGKKDAEGSVFYIFAAVSAVGTVVIWRIVRC